MDEEYAKAVYAVNLNLLRIIDGKYGPQHTIDILQECIKLLKPYAKKQEEVTHA